MSSSVSRLRQTTILAESSIVGYEAASKHFANFLVREGLIGESKKDEWLFELREDQLVDKVLLKKFGESYLVQLEKPGTDGKYYARDTILDYFGNAKELIKSRFDKNSVWENHSSNKLMYLPNAWFTKMRFQIKKLASKRAMIEEEELGDNVFPMSERALQNAIRFLHNQGTSEGVFRAAVIITNYNCCGRANEVSYFSLSTTMYHADTGAITTVWNEEKTGSRYFLRIVSGATRVGWQLDVELRLDGRMGTYRYSLLEFEIFLIVNFRAALELSCLNFLPCPIWEVTRMYLWVG